MGLLDEQMLIGVPGRFLKTPEDEHEQEYRRIADDICANGTYADDLMVEYTTDDAHELVELMALAASMNRGKVEADATEIGRRFLSLVRVELDAYCIRQADKAAAS